MPANTSSRSIGNPECAWHSVQAETADGKLVGHVSYGVSPLNDRVYVDGLKVVSEFRENGYATSTRVAMAKQCSPEGNLMPMTPLHEVFASSGFWTKLREGAVPGLVVTQDVRASEMNEEAKRWREPAPSPTIAPASAKPRPLLAAPPARAHRGLEPER